MSGLVRLPARGCAAYPQLVTRRPVTMDVEDQVSGILGAVRHGVARALGATAIENLKRTHAPAIMSRA
jgi:hypothetical protein